MCSLSSGLPRSHFFFHFDRDPAKNSPRHNHRDCTHTPRDKRPPPAHHSARLLRLPLVTRIKARLHTPSKPATRAGLISCYKAADSEACLSSWDSQSSEHMANTASHALTHPTTLLALPSYVIQVGVSGREEGPQSAQPGGSRTHGRGCSLQMAAAMAKSIAPVRAPLVIGDQ